MRLNKKRILSIIGTVVAISTLVGVAGVLNFYARLDYNVSSGNFLYVDDTLAQETVLTLSATLYPGENMTDTHTIRLDESAPTDYLTVSFTIDMDPNDAALSTEIQNWEGIEISTMNVVPASEVNAQNFSVFMELDPLAESGVSYTVNVTVGYGGVGY